MLFWAIYAVSVAAVAEDNDNGADSRQSAPYCPLSEVPNTNITRLPSETCYYDHFEEGTMTFAEAYFYCRKLDGRLLTLDSVDYNSLKNYLATYSAVNKFASRNSVRTCSTLQVHWLYLKLSPYWFNYVETSTVSSEYAYKSLDGDEIPATYWKLGQPNTNQEQCACGKTTTVADGTTVLQLEDYGCANSNFYVMCQNEAACPADFPFGPSLSGKCHGVFGSGQNYEDAAATCAAACGRLPTAESLLDVVWLGVLFSETDNFYLDYRSPDQSMPPTFVDSTGQTADLTGLWKYHASTETYGPPTAGCVFTKKYWEAYRLTVGSCGIARPVVCEYSPPCPTTTSTTTTTTSTSTTSTPAITSTTTTTFATDSTSTTSQMATTSTAELTTTTSLQVTSTGVDTNTTLATSSDSSSTTAPTSTGLTAASSTQTATTAADLTTTAGTETTTAAADFTTTSGADTATTAADLFTTSGAETPTTTADLTTTYGTETTTTTADLTTTSGAGTTTPTADLTTTFGTETTTTTADLTTTSGTGTTTPTADLTTTSGTGTTTPTVDLTTTAGAETATTTADLATTSGTGTTTPTADLTTTSGTGTTTPTADLTTTAGTETTTTTADLTTTSGTGTTTPTADLTTTSGTGTTTPTADLTTTSGTGTTTPTANLTTTSGTGTTIPTADLTTTSGTGTTTPTADLTTTSGTGTTTPTADFTTTSGTGTTTPTADLTTTSGTGTTTPTADLTTTSGTETTTPTADLTTTSGTGTTTPTADLATTSGTGTTTPTADLTTTSGTGTTTPTADLTTTSGTGTTTPTADLTTTSGTETATTAAEFTTTSGAETTANAAGLTTTPDTQIATSTIFEATPGTMLPSEQPSTTPPATSTDVRSETDTSAATGTSAGTATEPIAVTMSGGFSMPSPDTSTEPTVKTTATTIKKLTGTKKVVADVLRDLGCTWLVGLLSFLMVVKVIARRWTYEKILQTTGELSLLLAHVVLFTAAVRLAGSKAGCTVSVMFIQYLFGVHFLTMPFEAVHCMLVIMKIRNRGSLVGLGRTMAGLWGLPLLWAIIVGAIFGSGLATHVTCFLNFGHFIGPLSVVVAATFALAAVLLSDAAAGVSYEQYPLTDEGQFSFCVINNRFTVLISPLAFVNWYLISVMLYYQNFALHAVTFATTIALPVAIIVRDMACCCEVRRLIRKVANKLSCGFTSNETENTAGENQAAGDAQNQAAGDAETPASDARKSTKNAPHRQSVDSFAPLDLGISLRASNANTRKHMPTGASDKKLREYFK